MENIDAIDANRRRKGEKMKNVQIPYELFMLLIRHYLVEDDTCLDEIRQGLEKKLDSLVQHELYGKFKTAPTLPAETVQHSTSIQTGISG